MAAQMNAVHAIRMLAGLRLRRLGHMAGRFNTGSRAKQVALGQPKRQSRTRGKIVGWLLTLALPFCMLFTVANNIRFAIIVMYCHDQPSCDMSHMPHALHILGTLVHATPFNPALTRGLTMLLGLLWLLSVLYPVAVSSRTMPDWDLEWIATLPMSRTTMALSRMVERGLISGTSWAFIVISCAVLAWYANAGWLTPLVALLVAFPLMLIVGSIWTLIDLGLHIALAPATLRNLQAVLALLLAPVLYLLMSFGMTSGGRLALRLADATPQWAIWTPPGLAVQIINTSAGITALACYGLLLFETAVVMLLSALVLRHQLRAGLIAHGPRESGRSTPRRRANATKRSGWLSPIQKRELLLLLRDKRYLMQVLGLPLAMVGSQLIFNDHLLSSISRDPKWVAAFAFGIGAYTLIWSALSSLVTEGDTLWLLYTFPRSLVSMMWEKTRIYMVLALTYPLAIFVVCASITYGSAAHIMPIRYATGIIMTLLGMVLFAVIAQALSILAGVPSTPTRRQVSARYLYLFMLLAGFYGFAVTTDNNWYRATLLILNLALAYALWQKALDRVPYLIDQQAAPPARVSLADGLIAAALFFVAQICIYVLLPDTLTGEPIARMIASYIGAGAIMYASMWIAFWSLKTRDIPRLMGDHGVRAAVFGAVIGLLCALLGLAYLALIQRYHLFPQGPATHSLTMGSRLGLTALAVFAAPVFEEFLFRGLIFGGLRRTLSFPVSALASAALFAAVHPPASMVPVFVLGLGTAWVYQRKRILMASMATHAVYNAVIVATQLFVLYR